MIILCEMSAASYETMISILYLICILFIPVLLWSIYVSFKVKSNFKKFNMVSSKKGLPAHIVARQILDSEGLTNVQIGRCGGTLSDHYDPRNNTVYLSESVYNSPSIAAIGVAAHEVGHAIQHAHNYAPVKIRGALVPVLNISSKMLIPILIVNIFLTIFLPVNSAIPMYIYYAIFGIYALNMLFAMVTLPCEFNASSRAKEILVDMGMLDEDEIRGVSKVLRSAAMTYVASFVLTLIQLARILLIILSNRRRD